MTETLQHAILATLERDADRPCLAFVDGRGRFRWTSRGEVLEQALGAAGFLAELGLRPGQVGVVVSVDPRECATTVLGMLLGGAVPLLVAPPAIQGIHSSLKEIVLDVVRRTAAGVAVLPRGMEDVVRALEASSPDTRLELGFERVLAEHDGGTLARLPDPGDVAALQLTSGTTGFPRIAVWQHRRMLEGLTGMARGMEVSADDVYLNWTPLYHDMGLVNNFLFCQVQGLPLALLSPLDVVRRPSLWLRALADTGATTTWSPNFGFALATERVRDEQLEGVRLDRVRGFWNAAERVHRDTLERFQRRFAPIGVRREALKANFGCVETIGGVTFTDPAEPFACERVDQRTLQEEGVARVVARDDLGPDSAPPTQDVVSCGRPYPSLELLILDASGRPCPDGTVGEVAFRTSARLVEYLGQPEETARAVRGEHVLTGDLGYRRGGELFWTGRTGERINLQGKKLDPSELERVLFRIDGLRKGCFVAFGVEDAARGTELLHVLAEVEPASVPDVAAISADVRRRISSELGLSIEELALVPKGVLTKTSSGKRRHRHFRELYLAGALEVLHRARAGRLE